MQPKQGTGKEPYLEISKHDSKRKGKEKERGAPQRG